MDAKPIRVLDDAPERLVLIGCGGTGGYLLQQLCRLLYGLLAAEESRRAAPALDGLRTNAPPVPNLLLVDGDAVSGANL